MPEIKYAEKRLPGWMRQNLSGFSAGQTRRILDSRKANTVCESARCPNRYACYSRHTATFMILGETCTRHCLFCAVRTEVPEPVSGDEPERVALAARDLGIDYVVITSVTRDDLADEGAGQFARTILAVRRVQPHAKIEVLTPDFHARPELIEAVAAARPDVYNHNLETVERLQKTIRPQADYRTSLRVLETAKRIDPEILTKSGMMLGLGEQDEEIVAAARDLRRAGVDVLTVGQYLPPTPNHRRADRYVAPEKFEMLSGELKALGFAEVLAGPAVRSSYNAAESFRKSKSAS